MASCLAPRLRPVFLGACAILALAALPAASWAASAPRTGAGVFGTAPEVPPCRLAGLGLDPVPALMTGQDAPQLAFVQDAIDRRLGRPSASGAEPAYAEVTIPGWRSVGRAGALSLAVPGAGQLYAGSKRGYLFLGVEAVALLSYATFQAKSGEKRDEYYAYVGDPNDPNSRFSFDRLASTVSSEEMARLRTTYERDPAEFYQSVTVQTQYSSGWADPDERYGAQSISNEADKQSDRSRVSLYTLIANHLVSAADALNLARFNNIALRENLTLKLKMRPGGHRSSYAFTVTQKF